MKYQRCWFTVLVKVWDMVFSMRCWTNTDVFAKGETFSFSLNYNYVGTLEILEIYEVTYLILVWAA